MSCLYQPQLTKRNLKIFFLLSCTKFKLIIIINFSIWFLTIIMTIHLFIWYLFGNVPRADILCSTQHSLWYSRAGGKKEKHLFSPNYLLRYYLLKCWQK
jgi:hypothetical protein